MKQLGTKVQYFNMDIQITMPFVAVDEDGDICCYPEKPTLCREFWVCNTRVQYTGLGTVDLEGMDWKETLKEFAI